MAQKKGSRANYNAFFNKFKTRSGYIGSLLKNSIGNSVFEFEFTYKKDIEEAKDFLKEKEIKFVANQVNPKRIIVEP